MESLELAKAELHRSGATCVVYKDEKFFSSMERGIRPIVAWLCQDDDFVAGAAVADKVIGKAAAMLLIYGRAGSIYADVISDAAAAVLEEHGTAYAYGKRVPHIVNRDNTGMCPMEAKALGISSPKEAFALFSELLNITK